MPGKKGLYMGIGHMARKKEVYVYRHRTIDAGSSNVSGKET